MIPVNEPQNYLLVIEKLGSNKVTVEVSTPNYAFASYPFSENDIGVLRKINKKDLLVIARKMKLRNVKFPHETVYYAVFSKVITVPGSQVLTVSLGSRNPDQRYYIAHVDLTVYIKPKHCFPIVQQNLW